MWIIRTSLSSRGGCRPLREREPAQNDALGASVVFTRLLDKPFRHRYLSARPFRVGIVTGAMGALQDWGGLWCFALATTATP